MFLVAVVGHEVKEYWEDATGVLDVTTGVDMISGATVMVREPTVVPYVFIQRMVYILEVVMDPVVCEPLFAMFVLGGYQRAPCPPLLVPLQVSAPVEDHVTIELEPYGILVLSADIATVGGMSVLAGVDVGAGGTGGRA